MVHDLAVVSRQFQGFYHILPYCGRATCWRVELFHRHDLVKARSSKLGALSGAGDKVGSIGSQPLEPVYIADRWIVHCGKRSAICVYLEGHAGNHPERDLMP